MPNILKKILKLCVRLLLGLILLVLGIVLLRFGKQKIEEVQAHREIPELRAEMQSLSADHIPDNVSVLAIGEGVHGSREFQEWNSQRFVRQWNPGLRPRIPIQCEIGIWRKM